MSQFEVFASVALLIAAYFRVQAVQPRSQNFPRSRELRIVLLHFL